MNIDTKELLPALLKQKNPLLIISIFSMMVPIALLYGASKYASSSLEALVFFGIIGISALAYSAWVVSLVIKRVDNDSK